ncbi:hypothetical protein HRbin08_00857 [bacterium HR08]|nr:hypothetical protein HRbin08_00857 [bacterium HR08]
MRNNGLRGSPTLQKGIIFFMPWLRTPVKSRRLAFVVVVIPLLYPAQHGEAPKRLLRSSQQVFAEAGEVRALAYLDREERFYVLGGLPHRREVFLYDRRHHMLNRFFVGDATDIATDAQGRTYIAGDHRITIFDRRGRMLHSFPAPFPESLAVLSDGRIVIGSPTAEGLVHIYDPFGRRLASFGTMREFRASAAQNRWLNIGDVAVGRRDEIYYIFVHSPEPSILKFSPDGDLLAEFEIKGKWVRYIVQRQWESLAMESEGVGGFHIVAGGSVDAASGHIWVALPGSEMSGEVVHEYSPEGLKIGEYALLIGPRKLLRITKGILVTEGGIYVVTSEGRTYLFPKAASSVVELESEELENCPPPADYSCSNPCAGGSLANCKADVDAHKGSNDIVIGSTCAVGADAPQSTNGGCAQTVTFCDLTTGKRSTYSTSANCPPRPEGRAYANCNDRIDNDGDWLVDYDDEDCLASPILLDVAGDGFHLAGLSEPALFDFDANGTPLVMGWTRAGEDDAFLVLDRDGDGEITTGRELFGNATPLSSGAIAKHGFMALAEGDQNGDGWIDARCASACGEMRITMG